MLWSLACNITKRLLFETNNIASTVNMKPTCFYSISTFCILFFHSFFFSFVFLLVLRIFFFYFCILLTVTSLCVIYFSHLYVLHWWIFRIASRILHQLLSISIERVAVSLFLSHFCFPPFFAHTHTTPIHCIISLSILRIVCQWYFTLEVFRVYVFASILLLHITIFTFLIAFVKTIF